MNKEDYFKRLKEIETEYKRNLKQLNYDYALANNTIQIDDIIEGNGYIIQVKEVFPCIPYLSVIPECFYQGIQLKKDLKISKKQSIDARVYQSNAKIIKKVQENEK